MDLLLVEDNPGDARLLKELLTESGVLGEDTVHWERDLGSGLERYDETDLELVLLDLNLPDSSGEATVRRMTDAAPDLPVVVLTGHDDEETARRSLRLGAQDYLVKGEIGTDDLERSLRYSRERKAAEIEVRRKTRYQALFEEWPDGVLVVDYDGQIVAANDRIREIFGYPADALEGEELETLIPEAIREAHREHRREFERNPQRRPMGADLELYGQARDGSSIPIEVGLSPVTVSDDQRVIATVRDRSEHQELEQEVATWKRAIEDSVSAVAIGELDGTITAVNDALIEAWGYPDSKLIGMHASKLWADEAKARGIMEGLRRGEKWQGELTAVRADGTDFPVLVSASQVTDREGEPEALVGSFVDISERKRASERYRALFTESPVGIAVVGPEGRPRAVNQTLADLLGRSRSELCATPFDEFTPDDAGRDRDLFEKLARGEMSEYRIEKRFLTAGGGVVWGDLRVAALQLPGSDDQHQVAFVRDVTERKRAEAERERLTAILETTPDYVATANPDGEILWVNEPGREMLGVSDTDSLSGVDLRTTHPDWAQETVEEEGFPTAREKGMWKGETALLTTDGQEIPVSQIILAHRSEDGSVEYYSTIARDISETKEREEALRKSEERLRQAQRIAGVGNWVWNVESGDLAWSDEIYRICGFQAGEVDPDFDLFMDLVHPDDREAVQQAVQKALSEEEAYDIEHRLRTRGGELRWVREQGRVERNDAGEPIRMIGIAHDITDRKQAERKRRRSEKRYRRLFEDSRDAVYVTDQEGRIQQLNRAGRDLLGISEEELGSVRSLEFFENPSRREQLLKAVSQTGSVKGFPVELRTRDDELRHCRLTANARRDTDGELAGTQGIIRDVTEQKRMREQLEEQALYDRLTGVANRALLQDRLEHTIAKAERRDGRVGLLFVDLDRFKVVNDNLGHQAGDRVLKAVAERLQDAIRDADTLARIGGDEFLVLLEEDPTPSEAHEVARRIAEQLDAPFHVSNTEFYQAASIGIVVVDAEEAEPEELIRQADEAMYESKEAGETEVAVHRSSSGLGGSERLTRERELREAIEREEFGLHYQSIHDLESDDVIALEALARWPGEDEFRKPAQFIRLAEETGLIVSLGALLLERACREISELEDAVPLTVNVSAQQFAAGNLVELIERALEVARSPDQLQLEVTERVLLDARGEIEDLRAMGVGILVDDFGTGYSSLEYLKNLPVTGVKVDRSFISKLGDSPVDEAIVETVGTLGRSLDMSVVAEGIETRGQRERAFELGCGLGQGFHFSRPAPIMEWKECFGA